MGMEVFGLCDTLLLANRVAVAIDGPAAPLFEVIVTSLGGWRHSDRHAQTVRATGSAGCAGHGAL
ncbi:hypothetical protein [Massilia pseudoviolaceinigra]|uniref:hypothetical protein n=1 Tax=Massilia pseudoviolaceinigra TaxID=3057165 RepID=UPI00279681DA|nr:hypothetical protein [Massilia sp. CCM 9206]MDQ1923825.1 hypothetical protein [Massilia sp. CCM 9206]